MMTVHNGSSGLQLSAGQSGWGLAWRLARREIRGSVARFRVFLGALMLGVAAIGTVGSVAEAMRDDALASFVDTMIRRDIAPMLPAVPGLDPDAYRASVLERFRNPGIVHRLDQIAQDGSQKLPYRLGDTLAANRAAGRLPGHVIAALGCWIAFIMARAQAAATIVDPKAERLTEVGRHGDPAMAARVLAAEAIGFLPALAADTPAVAAIGRAAAAARAGRWQQLFAGACQ